jgi:hypothetical protein
MTHFQRQAETLQKSSLNLHKRINTCHKFVTDEMFMIDFVITIQNTQSLTFKMNFYLLKMPSLVTKGKEVDWECRLQIEN